MIWNDYEERKIKELQMKLSKNMLANLTPPSVDDCVDLRLQVYEAVKVRDKEKVIKLIMEELALKPCTLNAEIVKTIRNEYVLFMVALSEKIIRDRLLEVETAFSLLNAEIQLIEAAQSDVEAVQVVLAGVLEYIRCIDERIKKSRHCLIILVKEYIQSNINSKINIAAMAENIGTNSSYLSRLFHQKEGITIQQYICNQRIKQAENLLRFSNHTNEEISRFLGFSSQSHFGKTLKESTGMTPNQYRLQYKVR